MLNQNLIRTRQNWIEYIKLTKGYLENENFDKINGKLMIKKMGFSLKTKIPKLPRNNAGKSRA